MHTSLFPRLFYLYFFMILSSLILPSLSYAQISSTVLEQLKNQNIVDTTQTLTLTEIDQLKAQNEQLYKKANIDFKILMVRTTHDESIEQYALDVFNTLKIGDPKLDNGLLLLIAKEDRTMRFEVGYGLEGEITDLQTGHLLRYQLAPYFKQQRYFDGISAVQQELSSIRNSNDFSQNAHSTLKPQQNSSTPSKNHSISETQEDHVININQLSRFKSNYILVLFWNLAVSIIIVIYFSPIYSNIRDQGFKIEGLAKFLIIFLPLHHLFCWIISGINFFLLFPIYALILYLVFKLNHYLNFYHFLTSIYLNYLKKNLKLLIILSLIVFIFLLFFMDNHLITIFMTLAFMPFILGMVWGSIHNIAQQFKDIYPEQYQHWFNDLPPLKKHSTTIKNSSFHSDSSTKSSKPSRSSGGRSGGGGASGSW